MKIATDNIVHIQKRQRDDVGEVFEYEGKLLRGIFYDKVEMVRGMFDSGFIDDLVSSELLPQTKISNYSHPKYGMILEHDKIWPVIYPQEWSFSMLYDSALMVLNVARVARRHGYNMKDCHGFNVLIDGDKPKFIDLGSFHNNPDGVTGWQPYREFLRFYYYPLYTWNDGLEFISKLSIFSANLTPHAEHYIYRYRFLRKIGLDKINLLIKVRFALSDLLVASNLRVNNYSKSKIIQKTVYVVKKIADYTNRKGSDLDRLEQKIKNLKRPETVSIWKKYHDNPSVKSKRFEAIVSLVNKYYSDASTAIDIAGNQGKFSEIILKNTQISKVICQDLDEQALDAGYRKFKCGVLQEKQVVYVNYNAIAPIMKTTHPAPWERFQADIVFSLALLHHLILTQGFTVEDILDELSKYSKKYICIEFMPKGLWIHDAAVSVPNWYTVEWFRKSFLEKFELLEEQQIAENYIVFIGKKYDSSN